MNSDKNRRVLIIEDNKSIHDVFRKVLSPDDLSCAALNVTEMALVGNSADEERETQFEIDSAYQGQEGVSRVEEALAGGCPYVMAFVDMRMSPGWDGIKTVWEILAVDPKIQIVVCTAYAASSDGELPEQIGKSDRMAFLKKPFDLVETLRLANALTEKWHLVHFDLKETNPWLGKQRNSK